MKRVKLATAILIAIAIGSTGIWWVVKSVSSRASADILTSGFIEVKDISVASETSGHIVEIRVDEGDRIEDGMILIRLDDSLLKAQRQQAEANVGLAKASLEQATMASDGAKKAWENALDVQGNPLELETRIIAAQGELDSAEVNLERIKQERAWDYWQGRLAEVRRDTAQKALDNLLLIRDHPQEINAAVDQTRTAYETATSAVKVATHQLEQAEAFLRVIEVQLGKLVVSSPASGVVAARFAEVGEIIQASAPILTITQLEEVTLTTYVPESKIGLVKLGQEALVSVDSYPNENFSGEVVFISPQAQFTPRNVQLKEEREKTVFAVKIRLDNPDQKLKPGMPADARIIISSGK